MVNAKRAAPSPSASAEVWTGNAAHLRRLNLDRVLAVVMDLGAPLTRAELIEATGLSAPTVSSLVSQLIRLGLVRELGTGPSRGGRRPSVMEFNARHGFVAAIDLGATRTRLAVADLGGELLSQAVVPTPSDVDPADLLSRMASGIRALLREAGIPAERLLAVVAGAPGAVDRERGMVAALASNLKGGSNVPVAEVLEKELGAPVVVENDVNLAILGERWRGAARGHDTCAFISVGMGIGAGIVLDGELYRGHHSMAGEIALMCMGPQYVDANLEPRDCLETLAGLKGLAERWPPAARSEPDRWVEELFEAAENGDPGARETVEGAATLIGIAAANLSLVLDPSLIVLGGAVATQGKPFVEHVRKIVGRVVPAPPEIAVSALGKEAPLWGALLLATREARKSLRPRLQEAQVPA